MNMLVRCAVLHGLLFSCEVHGKAVLEYAEDETPAADPARSSRVARGESVRELQASTELISPTSASLSGGKPAADGGASASAAGTGADRSLVSDTGAAGTAPHAGGAGATPCTGAADATPCTGGAGASPCAGASDVTPHAGDPGSPPCTGAADSAGSAAADSGMRMPLSAGAGSAMPGSEGALPQAGASAPAMPQAGAPAQDKKRRWICMQVGRACECAQRTSEYAQEEPTAEANACATPKPTCCYRWRDGANTKCQCLPNGSPECEASDADPDAERIATCPPSALEHR